MTTSVQRAFPSHRKRGNLQEHVSTGTKHSLLLLNKRRGTHSRPADLARPSGMSATPDQDTHRRNQGAGVTQKCEGFPLKDDTLYSSRRVINPESTSFDLGLKT